MTNSTTFLILLYNSALNYSVDVHTKRDCLSYNYCCCCCKMIKDREIDKLSKKISINSTEDDDRYKLEKSLTDLRVQSYQSLSDLWKILFGVNAASFYTFYIPWIALCLLIHIAGHFCLCYIDGVRQRLHKCCRI